MDFYIALLSENAAPPRKGSKGAAGYDLYAAYDYNILAQERQLVQTDIQVKLPKGTYGRVAPRSGLALKYGIDILAGVIDEDYRGSIGVVVINTGKNDFSINKGDRIAQLILEKIHVTDPIFVDKIDDETYRNLGGFGSTGSN